MQAGKLDRTIHIERATTVIDDYGVPSEGWERIAKLRAQVIQQSTDEFLRASGESTETVIVFRTRYVDGITLADRVIYQDRPHNLIETKELGRRRGLELRCKAVGA